MSVPQVPGHVNTANTNGSSGIWCWLLSWLHLIFRKVFQALFLFFTPTNIFLPFLTHTTVEIIDRAPKLWLVWSTAMQWFSFKSRDVASASYTRQSQEWWILLLSNSESTLHIIYRIYENKCFISLNIKILRHSDTYFFNSQSNWRL